MSSKAHACAGHRDPPAAFDPPPAGAPLHHGLLRAVCTVSSPRSVPWDGCIPQGTRFTRAGSKSEELCLWLNVHLVTALLTKRAGRAGSPTSQLQSRPGSSRLHAVHAGRAPLVTSCPYGLVSRGVLTPAPCSSVPSRPRPVLPGVSGSHYHVRQRRRVTIAVSTSTS